MTLKNQGYRFIYRSKYTYECGALKKKKNTWTMICTYVVKTVQSKIRIDRAQE